MLEFLFGDQLSPQKLEERDSYYEVVARNRGIGFFQSLRDDYQIKCTNVLTQVRNGSLSKLRKSDLANLGDALGTGIGSFGLVAYRGGDRDEMLRWCRKVFRNEGKAVLPIDDQDFTTLIGLKGDAEHTGNSNGEVEDPRIAGFLAERLGSVVRPGGVFSATMGRELGGVFISYSRRDRTFLDQFKEHLNASRLVRDGQVSIWDDSKLNAGLKWREEIARAVPSTTVAVLLVSYNFLNSAFIAENELGPFQEAADAGNVTLFPIMVKPTDLEDSWLDNIQFALRTPPLSKIRSRADRDEVYVRLVQDLREIV
jgi:hypothetical protein